MSRTTACPTCKKAAVKDGNPAFPFCCERCRLIDLGKWLSEDYRIPDSETPLDDAAIEEIVAKQQRGDGEN